MNIPNPQDIILEDEDTHGSVFVPLILGSDKTMVSVGTGNNEYYPLYLSIGNVQNNVRRGHQDALVLIAFLAIPKSGCHTLSLRTCPDPTKLPENNSLMLHFATFVVNSFTQLSHLS